MHSESYVESILYKIDCLEKKIRELRFAAFAKGFVFGVLVSQVVRWIVASP